MRAIWSVIERVADTDATILMRGESGVGKDFIGRAIHARSARRAGPFIKVNCAAIPAELLESELFGHERGAFTGAYRRKLGLFECARGGTICLDEIAELSLPLAGEASACPPGFLLLSGRRSRLDLDQRPGHRRHEPRPRARDGPARVP